MKFLCAILSAVAVLMFSSCSSKNEQLEKLIPGDVAGVVCINVPNVLEKSEIKQGDDLVIPDQLKSVINANDDQTFGQLIKNIPNMGVEIKDKAYLFFPNDMMEYAVLIALDDEDKARTHISHKTGAQFEDVEGVDMVVSDMNVWCVNDDILFLGRLLKTTDAKKVAKWVNGILEHEGECIADVEAAKGLLDPEKEITAYFDMRRLSKQIRSNAVVNDFVKKYPIAQLFVESDIKSVKFDMSFKDSSGELNVDIAMDDNGEFATLMKSLLQQPSDKFLKTIPNTMTLVTSFSVNGAKLASLPQVKQMMKMVNDMPFLGHLDLNAIVESIDGPIAVGVATDPVFADEYNYVFAAKSTNPNAVVELISRFASSLGQDPELYDGEHIYAYNNKQVRLGIIDDVVYVKMLNYEQTEPNSDGNVEMCKFFAATPLGVYSRLEGNGVKSTLSLGMKDLHSAKGEFKTSGNAMLQFISLLCSVKPVEPFDYDMSAGVDADNMVGEFQQL